MTPTTPTSGDVELTASLSATGTPDNTNFLRGDNTWAEADKTFVFTQAVPSHYGHTAQLRENFHQYPW